MKEKFWKRHPYLFQIILSVGIGLIYALVRLNMQNFRQEVVFTTVVHSILEVLLFAIVIGGIFIYPFILTIYHIILLYRTAKQENPKVLDSKEKLFDFWTLFLAFVYELFYLLIQEVDFSANWDTVLINNSKHTPIFTEAYPSVIVLLLLCLICLLVLYFKSVNELPPLCSVLCFSGVYIGMIWTFIWTIQIIKTDAPVYLFSILPAIVVFCIGVRLIILKVKEYSPEPNRMSKIDTIPILRKINQILRNSKKWPFWAFLFMIPVLAGFVMVLVLFGQSPDILIKAFTDTSEWNLSDKISPQNIYQDEHYLCTVAAGGHKSVVKPIRKGMRHGHPVIVNRQLLVANAFEQILEEKTPKLHCCIRQIYDTWGLPIAKVIRSRYMADSIWFLMKPLEWIFLLVIYLIDQHPEDRIAIQYTDSRGIRLLAANSKSK